jgi:hypothetical protein
MQAGEQQNEEVIQRGAEASGSTAEETQEKISERQEEVLS